MKLTWFGHSAFRLEFGSSVVLIDPFLTGNPSFTGDRAAAIAGATHVLLTHGHSDHVGDTLSIAAETGAKVVTNYDLCMYLANKGLKAFDPMNCGGTTDQGDFTVTLTNALHSSADFHDGVSHALGNPNGLIIKQKGGLVLYAMGDTDMMPDMGLIAEYHKPTHALVPVGDRFTHGRRCRGLRLQEVLPVRHGRALPLRDLRAARPDGGQVRGGHGRSKTKVAVPKSGESVTF